MVDKSGDATVRVELGELGSFVLSLAKVKELRFIRQAKLPEDHIDLPVNSNRVRAQYGV